MVFVTFRKISTVTGFQKNPSTFKIRKLLKSFLVSVMTAFTLLLEGGKKGEQQLDCVEEMQIMLPASR